MERNLKKPKAFSEVEGPLNHDIDIYNLVGHLSWKKNILEM